MAALPNRFEFSVQAAMSPNRSYLPLLPLLLLVAGVASAAELDKSLKVLQSVDREGKAAGDPTAAWKTVSQANPSELPTLLAALDEAKPLGANWIRAAIDSIAEKSLGEKRALPVDKLRQFVLDREHVPRARRLAYDWLCKADQSTPDELLPKMLDDPSLELRRDAVAREIDAAKKQLESENKAKATATFQSALAHARDLDQAQLLAAELRKLGETVDLARHFGFITEWQVIGPFDNSARKGFAAAYPPEKEFLADARYQGKQDDVAWKPASTKEEFGNVDLNEAIAKEKSVVAYARADFYSDAPQPAELRLGSLNATKIWLNGELLAENEVYHALTKMDQYIGHGKLKAGKNVILVKICQNEQTEDWAVDWKFQLRVCDTTGTAIHSQTATASRSKAGATK
jgi:hypothetical protein